MPDDSRHAIEDFLSVLCRMNMAVVVLVRAVGMSMSMCIYVSILIHMRMLVYVIVRVAVTVLVYVIVCHDYAAFLWTLFFSILAELQDVLNPREGMCRSSAQRNRKPHVYFNDAGIAV